MTTQRRLKVELTLLGPILTHGGEATAPGIDAPAAHDGRGRVMLPFSLVKGKVLDAFRDLPIDNALVAGWFGRPSAEGAWEPDRGSLRFTDFVTEQKPAVDVIERVRIDHDTGAAKRQMLAMLEAPFGYGQEVVFTGHVDFIADDATAKEIETALDAAFRWVPAYGSLRTVGFGRTKNVCVKPAALPDATMTKPAEATVLPLRLTPDRPLCLVGRKHSRNHFDSLEHIPGAVLKGAVARLLLELAGSRAKFVSGEPQGKFAALWRNFEHVRFAEARPMLAGATARPVVPPLSVVVARDDAHKDQWCDVALWPGPGLIGDSAPAFDIDWKPKEQEVVEAAFGVVHPPRERRVRTAIDMQTGRAAENKLFSYGLVREIGFEWETEIGLEGIPATDHADIRRELALLFAHGLPFIGKTRATAAVALQEKRTPPTVHEGVTPPGGLHVVTLQTDCLMTNPDVLQKDGLEEAYRKFWLEASGGAFNLVRFFARQSLHGGFLTRRAGRGGYEPYLVTDRGSVFVLEPTDKDNPAAVSESWRAGLPVPKWIKERYNAGQADGLWKACPFLPHVGFGEVAIDLACHTTHRLPEEPS